MIAKLLPGSLDFEGIPVCRPRKKHSFHPTFPVEAYFTQPLTVRCWNLYRMAQFLSTCRYVSDSEQFGIADYWMPPEDFEKSRAGDCDCAAIWTWRQLVEMGYEARYVVGTAGSNNGGHAWVHLKLGEEWHLVEPMAARGGLRFPAIYTFRHKPRISAAWDGERVRYFEHQEVDFKPTTAQLLALIAESGRYKARAYSRLGRAMVIHSYWRLRRSASRIQRVTDLCWTATLDSYLLRPASIPCGPSNSQP